MHSKMMQWSRGLYLAGIVLALVAVVPVAWFPFTLTKVALFAVCLLAAAICFIAGGGVRELTQAHGLKGALLVWLLPVAYLISMAVSVDHSLAISGYSIEVDTLLFTVLASLAFFFAFMHFRTLRTARQLLTVVFWALVAASIFQLISVLFGAIPLSTFADRSVNLIGKWNDLGILVGFLVLLSLVRTEYSTMSNLSRILHYVFGAALIVLLGVINFSAVWGMLLAASLVVALISFLGARRVPIVPLALAAVSLALLIWGSSLNTGLTKIFPVSSLEVRPSWSATSQVISASHDGFSRVLVGTGPSTFTDSWIAHKPAEVNQSQFWNLDFSVGYSSFLTAYGTVGVLGVIAWLIPSLLVLAAVLRALRMHLMVREDRDAVVALTVGALLAWVAFILYVPSGNLVLFAMVLSGAAFGFLWRQGQAAAAATEPTRIMQWSMLALMLVLVVLSAWTTVATGRRLVAEAIVGHGTAAVSANDPDAAMVDAKHALGVETTADTLRFAITADSAKLAAIAQDTKTPAADLQKQFSSLFQDAVNTAAQAHQLNPLDYRPVLAAAQLYDFLSTLKVQGAAQQAASTYGVAEQLNPTNPQIPLLVARLAANAGDGNLTQSQLKQALTLKPNYTDAMLLLVQLAVSQNDLNTAVQAAQAAVQTAPGVPSLWFELGLLLYSGNDTKDAIVALEQALKLQPDYANAQYFLGLSYAAQGRTQDAENQFTKLAQSNPDNNEVKQILANLLAGKKPFDGIQTATPPQDRKTAPVQQ